MKPTYQSIYYLDRQLDYESLFLGNLYLFLVYLFSHSLITRIFHIWSLGIFKRNFLIRVMKLLQNL